MNPSPRSDNASLQPPDTLVVPPGAGTAASLKIVVNGRTVVERHFLQQTMDAMVRRALADEPLLDRH